MVINTSISHPSQCAVVRKITVNLTKNKYLQLMVKQCAPNSLINGI